MFGKQKPARRFTRARCKDCGPERPASPPEFARGVPVYCPTCRIGRIEYIGTGARDGWRRGGTTGH